MLRREWRIHFRRGCFEKSSNLSFAAGGERGHFVDEWHAGDACRGTLALLEAEIFVDSADVISALTLDALRGTDVAFDERIHSARPHAGQIKTAANLRKMLEGSEIRKSHAECNRVQDAYSLRCIPQVHGAVRDTLAHCRGVFETEAIQRWIIRWSS